MEEFHILGQSSAGLALIVDILYAIYKDNFRLKIINNISNKESEMEQVPFLINNIEIEELFHEEWSVNPNAKLLITSGITKTKMTIYNFFKSQHNITFENYSTLIHPETIVSKSVKIGRGTVINPGVTVAPYTSLGNFTFINRSSSVGHHNEIGNFVNINPGATICGKIKIGNNVTIGAGATVIDNIEIGENTIIGAGSVVTKSIPANVIAYGSPAKIVKSI